MLSSKTLQRAERNFLRFIDYNVRLTETELLAHYDGIMEYCSRKQGGWHGLMNIGNENPRPQRVESPKAHPAPIGSGRPRASTPRQHPVPLAAGPEEMYPQTYTRPSYPAVNAPTPPPPAPPTLLQPDADSQSSYPRPDRQRSRSPSRRSYAPPISRADCSWKRPAHGRPPSPGRYMRDDHRARYPREHVYDRNDEPRTRRTRRHPSSTPYHDDRYHRRSHRRGSPDTRLPPSPLYGLPGLHDLPDYRPRWPALSLDTPAGNRRYEDLPSTPPPPPSRPYYGHDGWYWQR